MTSTSNTLPYFPLGIVVIPGETARLHIFEPRYKQLVNESFDSEFNFGIPFVNRSKFCDFGTEVKINKIINVYENGELDIEVQGIRIFKVLNYRNPLPEKLYSGGEVEFIHTSGHKTDVYINKIFQWYMSELMQFPEKEKIPEKLSYNQIAENILLSQEDKYKFISLISSMQLRLFLSNFMKLNREIYKLEKQIQNRFVLN